jgi:hypothetical protein
MRRYTSKTGLFPSFIYCPARRLGSDGNDFGLYIGETIYKPENRLTQHLNGNHASRVVKKRVRAVSNLSLFPRDFSFRRRPRRLPSQPTSSRRRHITQAVNNARGSHTNSSGSCHSAISKSDPKSSPAASGDRSHDTTPTIAASMPAGSQPRPKPNRKTVVYRAVSPGRDECCQGDDYSQPPTADIRHSVPCQRTCLSPSFSSCHVIPFLTHGPPDPSSAPELSTT